MSLLEDVFLQDEANEAEELERVIEGDEFEERRRSDSDENSEKDDEAEEDKKRVEPTKTKTSRVVKNPRFLLNPARLTGPRGIQVIPEHFKDFKFKGKGYEKEDLDVVLKRLEHWAYRLYPKFQFEDCLKKIEMLGKKRPVAVHLHKIRSDQFLFEDTVVQKNSSDEDVPMPVQEEDEFDKLLQQQIDLARTTPAPNSAKKPVYDGSVSPKDKRTTSLIMPKATSSPSINNEQRERMLRSRRLAEERRLARLKNAANTDNTTVSNELKLININEYSTKRDLNTETNMETGEEINKHTDEKANNKKHNRSNVIDSSDEETEIDTCVSITVDVHTANKITVEDGVVETEKSCHNTNSVHHLNARGAKETENEIQRAEHTTCNSNSNENEGNQLIADSNKIENNIDMNESHVNSGHSNVNLKLSLSVNKKSGENDEQRCDVSDLNTDLNKHIIFDKNTENILRGQKVSETEGTKKVSVDTEDIENRLNKQALLSSGTSYGENDISGNVLVQDIIHKEKNETEIVPEEIIGDVMDVDFTEDF